MSSVIAAQRGGQRKPCRAKKRSPRPASLDQELKARGIKRSARGAIRTWVDLNPIHRDWTHEQLAEAGLCHRSQICRAIPQLLTLGLVTLKSEGCRGDQPKAAVFTFTEALYLLRHCAKRPSPFEYSPIPKESNNTQHTHHPKEGLADALPDSWRPFWDDLVAKVRDLPGTGALNLRSLILRIRACPLSPQEAFQVLDAAMEMAPSLTHLRDSRAWVLSCLTHPNFTKKALAPKAPAPVPEPATAEQVATIHALEQEGLDQAGAITVAQALDGKVESDLLPFVLEAAQATLAVRTRRHSVNSEKGLLVHLLRQLDTGLLDQAKRLRSVAIERRKMLRGTGSTDLWDKVSPQFRALPAADRTLEAWLLARKNLEGVHPDAPGFLDLHGVAQQSKAAVARLARTVLDERVQAQLLDEVGARLADARLEPGSVIGQRVFNFHLNREVLRLAGLDLE